MRLYGREWSRELARIRDKHTCKDCGRVWKKGKRRFDTHHINGKCGKLSRKYDRISSIGGLITLCHRCHFNRPEHSVKKKGWGNRLSKVSPKEYSNIRKLRDQRLTLKEIGGIYGVTRERIRQILLIH